MSDRPSAVNGKRSNDWGTRRVCPACGECLCFGCHPAGPCLDDADSLRGGRADQPSMASFSGGTYGGGWMADGPTRCSVPGGLRLRVTNPPAGPLR